MKAYALLPSLPVCVEFVQGFAPNTASHGGLSSLSVSVCVGASASLVSSPGLSRVGRSTQCILRSVTRTVRGAPEVQHIA